MLTHKPDINGEFVGTVMAPELACEQFPDGLGFKVDRFNPGILFTNSLFSSAIDELRVKYGAVFIPDIQSYQEPHFLDGYPYWRWGLTGTGPVAKMPHVDKLRSIGLYAKRDTHPQVAPRVLGVTTFERGYEAYLRTFDALVAEGGGFLLPRARLDEIRECLTEWILGDAGKGRTAASLGVDIIRNLMPSGIYGQMNTPGQVLCTKNMEARFASRLHQELGIAEEKPKVLLNIHRRGTLSAVSGDVFHFSAGGDLDSGTVAFTFLREFGRETNNMPSFFSE